MPVDIALTNVSAGDINASEILGGAELNYDIDVRDEDGKLGPETSVGRKLHGKDPNFPGLHGSIKSHTVRPGEVQKSRALLNKVYDLQPGNYTVNVARRDPVSGLIVKSNTITITVTP